MLFFVHPCLAWLRQRLSWSVNRQAVQEGLAAALLLVGAAALWWASARLALPPRLLLWGLVLVAAAAVLRRGWLKLFGPVLFYDMVRNGRRSGHIVLRCLYASVLIYVLVVVYLLTLEEKGTGFQWLTTGRALADFTASFFHLFMGIQMLAAFVLTPAYTAGAIAAEKERQSFDALLATDLRNREIVLSMFVSRLANLGMVLLTGLPILGLLEFLGGLDPHLVLAGYAVTGLTILSLGALGLLQSVQSRKPRAAIMRTYIWALAYLLLASLSGLLLLPQLELASFPSTDDWASPVTLEDVVQGLNVGNPFWAVGVLVIELRTGATLDKVLPPLLTHYAWFHGVVTVLCLSLAVVRLRTCALQEAADSARKAARRADALPRFRLLPLRGWAGTWPLLWKEIIVDTGPRPGWIKRLIFGLVVALVLWPGVHLANWYGGFPSQESWWEGLREMLNLWICTAGVLIGGPMLIQVGVRAAGSISGERARQTLDGLLTTPLEANAIVFAKWLGSLFTARWSWLLLGVVWTLGGIAGAVTLKGLAGFLLAWLVYAGFMAALGLYFSVVSGTSQRATLWTLLAALLLLALSCLLAFDLSWYGSDSFSLVPPATLWLLPWMPREVPAESHPIAWEGPFFISLGLVLCASLTVGLWLLASYRFRVAIGRQTRRKGQAASTNGLLEVASTNGTQPQEQVQPGPAEETQVTAAVTPPSPPVKAVIRKTGGEALPLPPRPRLLWLKRLRPALLVLLPLALLQAWYFLQALSAERRLQKAIAEADRLDPGWRLEDLEAKRGVPPDDQNSALQIQAARKLLPNGGWPSPDFQQAFFNPRTTELDPPVLLPEEDVRLLKAELKRAEKALVVARQLVHLPKGRQPIKWSKDGIGTLLEPTQHVREIAMLLDYDAWLRCQQGDVDGALESCRAIFNTERSIGDEPALISMMVRAAVRGMGVREVERALAQGQPSEAALATLQEQLAELETDRLLLIATRGERALNDRMMHALQVGAVSPKNIGWLFGLGGGTKPGLPGADELVIFLTNSLPGQRAALLQYNNRMVEIAKLPDHQQDQQFTLATGSMVSQPIFVRLMAFSVNRVAVSYRRALAELRCARVAVAAERFRLRKNRWPGSLEELVQAGLLPEVPDDPCDGLKLRYCLLKDGVVIYSVGPTGKDNGGNLDRKNPNAVGSNWGLRLWDVVRRRQASSAPVDAGLRLQEP
jgi:ABC-type transport system involved in multi-copper enzyme maturation permease subunit